MCGLLHSAAFLSQFHVSVLPQRRQRKVTSHHTTERALCSIASVMQPAPEGLNCSHSAHFTETFRFFQCRRAVARNLLAFTCFCMFGISSSF